MWLLQMIPQEGGISIDNQTLLIILGTGGLASLGAFFRGFMAYRDSAEKRESKAIRQLDKWREDAEQRTLKCYEALDAERALTTYWSARSAAREYQLERAGLHPEPYAAPPKPPMVPPPLPTPAPAPSENGV